MVGFIISLIITGLIVGALGRLAVPGPNPMSIGATIAVGIAGSLVAGLLVRIFTDNYAPGLIVSVIVTAAIIWLMQRRNV